jgi:hypothetical protein
VAAAGLLFLSLGQIVVGGDAAGTGQYLSGGVISAALATGFGLTLLRTLRVRSQVAG